MRFYNYSGNEVEVDESTPDSTIGAKTNDAKFHVKEYRGVLFDPIGVDARNAGKARWRETTEACFNLYTRFLRTKEGHVLRRAERELLDV